MAPRDETRAVLGAARAGERMIREGQASHLARTGLARQRGVSARCATTVDTRENECMVDA
jgi:hypothetical protein